MTRLFAGTPFDRPPVCDRCGQPETNCTCPPEALVRRLVPLSQQTARLTLERRKKGKTVTVIRGLSADGNNLPALLTTLKSACGAGGTIADDALELQGDHLNRLRTLLGDLGYRVRG